jgi:hypothetical protein
MNFIFEYFENSNYAFIMWPLLVTIIVIFASFIKKKNLFTFENKLFKNVKNNLIENKREVNNINNKYNKTVNLNNIHDPYSTWFNNCIEWSCLNNETTTKFNSFLLKSLNDSVNKFEKIFLLISIDD